MMIFLLIYGWMSTPVVLVTSGLFIYLFIYLARKKADRCTVVYRKLAGFVEKSVVNVHFT